MSKDDDLKKVGKILDMAKIAFSEDYLFENKKAESQKVNNFNKFNFKKVFADKKDISIQDKKEVNAEIKNKFSTFEDKDYFELEKIVLNCSKCNAANIRKNIIFGKGARPASLMIIGEGPGREEDFNNDIFIGKSGQYLHKWLEAINLNSKDEVYFSNIVKCFSNTNPTKDIVEACFPYLIRQIELVNPKVILVLGKIAGNTLFNQELPLKEMRGKIYTYRRIPCIVTYHPAAVLRNPDWRRPVWDDLKKVKQLINI